MRYASRFPFAASTLLLIAGLAACDFTVTNPGPVEDGSLSEEDAFPGLVIGARRSLGLALDNFSYISGALTREIHPAGSTGTYGISARQQQGILTDDETGGFWANMQRARWTAEDAIRRMREELQATASSNEHVAEASLYAGFSNRLLGESFCEAVIDGGPLESFTVFLTRAEQAFTDAMAIAAAAGEEEMALAAQAGRAQVRLDLGKYAEAGRDAAAIPDGFVYQMPYFSSEPSMYNEVFEAASTGNTFRAHTVWNTYYEAYYAETGDPRVGWRTYEGTQFQYGDAAVLHLGQVPWLHQAKYAGRASPIDLATATEMRLIQAEAILQSDPARWAEALEMVNAVRTGVTSDSTGTALEPWTATNADEAWTALKRERAIDLWLEGRRLNDVRRWLADGSGGVTLDALETATGVQTISHLEEQATCLPVPEAERQTNPNIPGT